jgi:hypothetical protein
MKQKIAIIAWIMFILGVGYMVYNRFMNYTTDLDYVSGNKAYVVALVLVIIILKILHEIINE